MSIGQQIRRKRIEKGLFQEELGYMAGMSRYAISRLENGEDENMRVMVLGRVARALETDILELIGYGMISSTSYMKSTDLNSRPS